jgi:cysteinyl-tRNA synthetase
MSKSKGNIIYVDTLMLQGYSAEEVRFFLTYCQYRVKMNYSEKSMAEVAGELRSFRQLVMTLRKRAGRAEPTESKEAVMLIKTFAENMDNDLDVKGAFDGLSRIMSGIEIDQLKPGEASETIRALQEIDNVLQVIF